MVLTLDQDSGLVLLLCSCMKHIIVEQHFTKLRNFVLFYSYLRILIFVSSHLGQGLVLLLMKKKQRVMSEDICKAEFALSTMFYNFRLKR